MGGRSTEGRRRSSWHRRLPPLLHRRLPPLLAALPWLSLSTCSTLAVRPPCLSWPSPIAHNHRRVLACAALPCFLVHKVSLVCVNARQCPGCSRILKKAWLLGARLPVSCRHSHRERERDGEGERPKLAHVLGTLLGRWAPFLGTFLALAAHTSCTRIVGM